MCLAQGHNTVTPMRLEPKHSTTEPLCSQRSLYNTPHYNTDMDITSSCCDSQFFFTMEKEGFAGLGMCSILVVQSEKHVIYRLRAGGGGREFQANMQEAD